MGVSLLFRRLESALAIVALMTMAFLPVADLLQRNIFDGALFSAYGLVEHFTLWVAFIGAAIATRIDTHLRFAAVSAFPPAIRRLTEHYATFLAAGVSFGLFGAAVLFILSELQSTVKIAGVLPVAAINAILPFAFAVMTWRYVTQPETLSERAAGFLGLIAAFLIYHLPLDLAAAATWPVIIALSIGAVLGAPIFVVIGGASLILFHAEGISIAAIPVETYRIVTSPLVPAIPLFTFTGYLLSHGRSPERLVEFFRAWFAWLPGGLVVSTTLVCAFFSALTGASGVTILALGGLLAPVLLRNGFSEKFATGLITSTGSIGLLFPPSLAIIMYAVVAKLPITDLFIAGLIPGLIMVTAISLLGIFRERSSDAPRPSFNLSEALAALWRAKWEIALPPFVVAAIFTGIATLIEAAALTAVYALAVQTLIHREMKIFRDVPVIALRSVTLTGGIFMILGVALGLNNYLVDAWVPATLAEWVSANVDSKVQFLLLLNLFLIAVGAMMDIVSAIIIVVPLISPVAQAFGIPPLHLAIIFLINLELGYLTPPVGLNLFLASSRFDKPLGEIFISILPFFAVLLGVLALVTFAPFLIIMP